MSDNEDFSDDDGAPFKFKTVVNPIDSLPVEVLKRVNALRNLQLTNLKYEVEYFRELHKLDLKYKALYDTTNEERRKIIMGEREASQAEGQWELGDSEADEINQRLKELQLNDKREASGVSGIPNFWLTVLQNANMTALGGMVQAIDEPVLKSLSDITCALSDDNTSFTLSFHFVPNDFFTNSVLTKEYQVKTEIDDEDPLAFDGPDLVKAKGCKIEWKSGKNTTMKVIKQKVKQKGKGKGGQKYVTKTEKRDSFFNFFSPPKVPEDPKEEIDDDVQVLLNEDFDVGFSIKEKVIPKAVLYFTGDILEDDDSEFGSEDDDEDEDDIDDED